MRLTLRFSITFLCASAVALVFGTESSAQIPAADGVIHACIRNVGNAANTRLVGANEACRVNEIRVRWNVEGSQNAVAGAIAGQLQHCAPNTDFTGYLVHIPGRAFSVFTGPDGSFQIDNVPAGTYALSVENNGIVLGTMSDVVVGSAPVSVGNLLLTDTQQDNNNCGACGAVCGAGLSCVKGSCEQAPPGQICVPGTTRSCYTGSVETQNVGACASGTQVCNAAGSAYGACTGETLPGVEACDGIDNDCDGTVDNGNPGGGAACNSGLPGACGIGTTACVNSAIVCTANSPGTAEVCDGIDNDCDGQVDEGGASCPAVPNGAPACTNGVCGVAACTAGFSDCNNAAVDGCEIDVRSNVNNCGACGIACPGGANGFPACVNGTCTLQCAAGFRSCGDICWPVNQGCPDLNDATWKQWQ